MTTIDENKPRGLAPHFFQRILKTAWFHILILVLVLVNAIATATMYFDHYKINPYQKIDHYYWLEVLRVILSASNFISHKTRLSCSAPSLFSLLWKLFSRSGVWDIALTLSVLSIALNLFWL